MFEACVVFFVVFAICLYGLLGVYPFAVVSWYYHAILLLCPGIVVLEFNMYCHVSAFKLLLCCYILIPFCYHTAVSLYFRTATLLIMLLRLQCAYTSAPLVSLVPLSISALARASKP